MTTPEDRSTNFDFSVLNIKDASKAVEKLIDVVSGAIGRIYGPIDKVLNAHADAKALQIMGRASREELALSERSTARITHVEDRRQDNIDAVVGGAIKALPNEISDDKVDEDWAAAFFESCKDVGNEAMQQIWASILAGEVTNPGSFSRRTLAIVKTMSVNDAEIFTRLCSISFEYSWASESEQYGFVPGASEVYKYLRKQLLSANDEIHMQNIGLLSPSNIHIHLGATARQVRYLGQPYEFVAKATDGVSPTELRLSTLHVIPFTKEGTELAKIAGGKMDEGYIELWCKHPMSNGTILRPV